MYILELLQGCPFETGVCSVSQDTCLGMRDTSGMQTRRGSSIRTLLEVKWEFRSLFLVGTVILGFLSIFMKSQASSPFEALNSACLSNFQRM